MKRPLRPLLTLSALLACSALARADFLDGRAVDSLGNGIAGVDIDVKNLGGGGDPTIFNDGTDANGFFHVTVPNGTYRVSFNPPRPPASTALLTEIEPVVIVGTADMGTVVLAAGVAIYANVLDPAAAPVAGINLDLVDSTGNVVDSLHDQTDALGNIAFASPAGDVKLRLDTTTVAGQILAPREFALSLSADVNLGTIQLDPGFLVLAIVRKPGGLPVVDCDLDVRDEASGTTLYTPGDNTNASGLVDTIVPAGLLRFDFCPPPSLSLAAGRVGPLSIGATTNLGIVNLPAGYLLSGHVQSVTGQSVGGVSLKVRDQATQLEIPVCDNATDALGSFQVLLPAGTFVIDFKPTAPPWSRSLAPNTVVPGTSVVNATLPWAFVSHCSGDGSLATPCPCGNSGLAGRGCQNSAGTGGALLTAAGWTLPDTVVLTSAGELPSALSIFLQGNANNASGVVFGDGVRCVAGTLKRLAVRNASAGSVSYPLAGDAGLVARAAQLGDIIADGSTRQYQVYYRDPNTGFCPNPPGNSWNVSNALEIHW